MIRPAACVIELYI